MIETKIEGNPESVRSMATWLRGTLATTLDTSSRSQVTARSAASRTWEGEAALAYQDLTRTVLKATDKHEPRVSRAAGAFDDYAVELTNVQIEMARLRTRATAGGLTINGTVIQVPPAVPPSVVEAGSPEEAAREEAIARIELYNTLAQECMTVTETFTQWVETNLPPDVKDSQEKDSVDTVFEEITGQLPNLLAGAGAGYLGLGLLGLSGSYKKEAAELRRRSRVAGRPWVRGHAETPAGKAKLDDLLDNAKWLKRFGKLLGPAGIGIDIYFGVKEGMETGDWTRVALTTGTSIAVGIGIGVAVAAGVVTAPVWLVVGAGAVLAAGAAWGVGKIYDNWDNITDWTGDRWEDTQDIASDAWEGATEMASGTWDAVTPW